MLFEGKKIEIRKLQSELNSLFEFLQEHIRIIPIEINDQILLLKNIRSNVYEDINQLQHKALLIKAIELLQKDFPNINKWYWHPKQTSNSEQADISGYCNKEVILNAELTTSLKPVGAIDKKMKKTLAYLSKKDGVKFYFVQTLEMHNRAKTKVRKMNLDVKVIQL